MSANVQDLILTPPDTFLDLLRTMTRELDSLCRHIEPAIHQHIDNHSEANCDQIRKFLDNAERELGRAAVLRAASASIVDLVSDLEGVRLETLLALMGTVERELRAAVDWLNDVLAKWGETWA